MSRYFSKSKNQCRVCHEADLQWNSQSPLVCPVHWTLSGSLRQARRVCVSPFPPIRSSRTGCQHPLFGLLWGPSCWSLRCPVAWSPAWLGHSVSASPDLVGEVKRRPVCHSHAASAGEMDPVPTRAFMLFLRTSEKPAPRAVSLRASSSCSIDGRALTGSAVQPARVSPGGAGAVSLSPFPVSDLKQSSMFTALETNKKKL